jgi:dephospho-CoA kinase
MLIGLTGQIGAGKTSVAQIMHQLGAVIIDADQIGREVVERDRQVRAGLVKAFGVGILKGKNQIDRAKLADLAFADERSRRKLNKIVHPFLLKELRRQVRTHSKSNRTVVIDAALLLEWKLDRAVSAVIVVYAPRNLRLRRMQLRGFNKTDILHRMRLQLPWKEFKKRSDFQISNTGTRASLRRQVTSIWRYLHAPE